MGQRSQIYVRYTKDNKHYLTARYFQWNYGERMISRCRYSLEWIKEMSKHSWLFTTNKGQLERILEVNFDMKDVQITCDIVKEYIEECDYKDESSFKEYVFTEQDNNDGKLFIDVSGGYLKYCFLDYDCNTENIMDAAGYMAWNSENWEQSEYIDEEQKELCRDNIKVIGEIAEIMSAEEVEDFINCIYEEEPKPF